MQQTTISGHHHTHYPIGEAVWIVAGIIVMLAFGDALTLLALTFAIVAMITTWWTYRKVDHRVERNDSELASVTHLRPALTGQYDPKATSARVMAWP